jgi:hypothetical protein
MSLIFKKPRLDAGEQIRWSSSANRSEGSWYASGGRLMFTDRRVIFQPNRFDAAIGKGGWESALTDIERVTESERDPSRTLAGGSRRRLSLETREGVESFVVNGLSRKVTEIDELLRSTR